MYTVESDNDSIKYCSSHGSLVPVKKTLNHYFFLTQMLSVYPSHDDWYSSQFQTDSEFSIKYR